MKKLNQKEIRIKLAKEIEKQYMYGMVYLTPKGFDLVMDMKNGRSKINKREELLS
ncbi:hypothetical protein [Metabacillus fastidiosus]|uniref:hypothetical protein n=1 Tax=Metabacillus fastidiosus TaxID=1458 RepID=UPI003D27BD9E